MATAPESDLRQTLLWSSVGCGCITLGLAATRFALQGTASPVGWLLVVVSSCLLAAPLLLLTRHPRLAGLAVPAIGLVGTVAMALLESGSMSEALFFLVIVPLAAAFLSGPRAALGFGVAAQVGLVVVTVATPAPAFLRLFGASGAAAFSTLLGWTYETQRRRVDRQRSETIETLEQAQAALVEARDRAQAANRAKSTFLAQMSHELRTPLNAVIGFSRLVASRSGASLDEKSILYLDRIDKNGLALLTLIQEILDLSKVEAGRLDVVLQQVDLGALVTEVTASLEAAAAQQHTRVTALVPGGLDPVTADPARVRQVLMNLVGNAVKFTEDGQVEVEVIAAGATVTRVEVRDSGIGIPEGQEAALFEPFVQGETGEARRYGGSGLGLAISRSMSRAMGWELTLSNNADAGAVARIDLKVTQGS